MLSMFADHSSISQWTHWHVSYIKKEIFSESVSLCMTMAKDYGLMVWIVVYTGKN